MLSLVHGKHPRTSTIDLNGSESLMNGVLDNL